MDATEFDGKDLEEALSAAAEALGRPSAELDYEILEEGRKGVFGLGSRPVRIRVAAGSSHAAKPEAKPATGAGSAVPSRSPAPVPASAPAPAPGAPLSPAGEAARAIFDKMGFDVRVEEGRRDGALELTLEGPDVKRLTARDGELLSSVEFVLNRMGHRSWPDEPVVHVVCRGFSSGRDNELLALVREAVKQVSRSGKPRRLRAMNPYERRIVHMTVREHSGLTTVSEGDGFMKRVRVEKIAP
jgi:spoIIIJ-associated protein